MRFWNNCHRVRSKIKGLQKVFDSKQTNEHKQIDKIDYGDLWHKQMSKVTYV